MLINMYYVPYKCHTFEFVLNCSVFVSSVVKSTLLEEKYEEPLFRYDRVPCGK